MEPYEIPSTSDPQNGRTKVCLDNSHASILGKHIHISQLLQRAMCGCYRLHHPELEARQEQVYVSYLITMGK